MVKPGGATTGLRSRAYRSIRNGGRNKGRDVRFFRNQRFEPLQTTVYKPRDISDLSALRPGALRAGFTSNVRSQYIDAVTGELVVIYNPDDVINDVGTRKRGNRVDYASRTRDANRRSTQLYKQPRKVDTGSFVYETLNLREPDVPGLDYSRAVKRRDLNTYFAYANNPYGAGRDVLDVGVGVEEGIVPQRFQLQHKTQTPSVSARYRDAKAREKLDRDSAHIEHRPMSHGEATVLAQADANSFGVYSTTITNRNKSKLERRQAGTYAHLGSAVMGARDHIQGVLERSLPKGFEQGAELESANLNVDTVPSRHVAYKAAQPLWGKDDDMYTANNADTAHVLANATMGRNNHAIATKLPGRGTDAMTLTMPDTRHATKNVASQQRAYTMAAPSHGIDGVQAQSHPNFAPAAYAPSDGAYRSQHAHRGDASYLDAPQYTMQAALATMHGNINTKTALPKRADGTLDVASLQPMMSPIVASGRTPSSVRGTKHADELSQSHGLQSMATAVRAQYSTLQSIAKQEPTRGEDGMQLKFSAPRMDTNAVHGVDVGSTRHLGSDKADALNAARTLLRELPTLKFQGAAVPERPTHDARPRLNESPAVHDFFVNTSGAPTPALQLPQDVRETRKADAIHLS